MSHEVDPRDLSAAMPPEALELLQQAGAAAEREGLQLFLVGGPVRDYLLDRTIRDVDLVVAEIEPSGSERSPAARLGAVVTAEAGRLVEHGRFGTVRIERGGAHVDVTSARSETYRKPGALPVVEAASIEDDLLRRDFSVNALAVPLHASAGSDSLTVLDPSGGLADLEARKLRVLHRRSFHDDPTRAIRAARLAGRLGFSLSRASRNALRDALRDGAFGAVSGDRFRREIQRCFIDAAFGLNPAQALRSLQSWHVLSALEPGLTLPREAVAPLRRLGRVIADPVWRSGEAAPWHAGMSIWLDPLPAALRKRVLARFSIRGEAAARVAGLSRVRERVLSRLEKSRGRGAVDQLLQDIPEDSLLALYAFAEPSARRRLVRWAAEDRLRRVPITGADIVELGLAGPDVGKVLARIRAAYLDGEVANREEAVGLARELARARLRPPRAGRRARTADRK